MMMIHTWYEYGKTVFMADTYSLGDIHNLKTVTERQHCYHAPSVRPMRVRAYSKVP